ncbi:unnamed protein product [Toxocara canis]|uniref:Lipoprotein n=1 Tax=Toxocara canis TaxID=6265 RepID=A0A183U8N2_TOXCA|nr:unnamed protein product [Toxocara canis]
MGQLVTQRESGSWIGITVELGEQLVVGDEGSIGDVKGQQVVDGDRFSFGGLSGQHPVDRDDTSIGDAN